MSYEGKIPPCAVEIEESVIGLCLSDKLAYLMVADILDAVCFYKEEHFLIWEAMKESFDNGKPTDLLSVANQLRSSGNMDRAGGMVKLMQLTERSRPITSIQHHALIIKEKWMLRETITIAQQTMRSAYEESADPFKIMGHLISSIDNVSSSIDKAKEINLSNQLKGTVKEIEEAAKNNNTVGKLTRFHAINRLGGLVKTDLIILAARPGMGKSSLAANIGVDIAEDYDEPVAFFELEMSHKQLWKREIARLSGGICIFSDGIAVFDYFLCFLIQ